MNGALSLASRSLGGQPLSLGMGVSLGLHALLAACLLCWPLGSAQADKPEEVQRVHLVELPPPPPPPDPPKPKPEPPPPPPAKPQPPRPQPRLAPRVQPKPASTTRPSPVASATQEQPMPVSGPSVATTGEAIGASGPAAAPAGGGQLPLGKEDAPEAAMDLGPYMRAVWQRIERQKRYPSVARARQVEGSVTLRFLLSTRGQISELIMVRSSGAHDLDQAAMQAVGSAAPFPAPPGATKDFWMELTIRFELD